MIDKYMILIIIISLFNVISNVSCDSEKIVKIKPLKNYYEDTAVNNGPVHGVIVVHNPDEANPTLPVIVVDHPESNRRLGTTVTQTVFTFNCSLTDIEGSHLIVYGTKGWTFPEQDVNITLKYPNEGMKNDVENVNSYIITGFTVALHIDGHSIDGYITRGGLLQDNIELLFTSSSITTLRYQFWLYGARKDTPELTTSPHHIYMMC